MSKRAKTCKRAIVPHIACKTHHNVPFMKRPFEWGICGGANLAAVCCVLCATWCHFVCFSCHLRQHGATRNVSQFKALTSRLFPHIRCCSVESGANSPQFTQDSHQIQGCEFRTKFARNLYEWGALLEGVRKNPPLLAPFLHDYPSHTTLCGWKVVWGQSPHVYAPFGG